MKFLLMMIFSIFLMTPSFATNEKFIDPKTYINTNSSEIRKKDAENFVNLQDQIVEQKRLQNTSNKTIPSSPQKSTPIFIPQPSDRDFVPIDAIVLDAGHGGKDPGGVSQGIEEKRLVFTILKKVHTLFRKTNKNINIYVTRKNDQFISLEDRVSKTARWSTRKNVLFISIHANIAYNTRVEGLEIYTLSDRASDPEALATERIENAGFSSKDIEQTDSLYSILADLIRDSTRKQSESLAKYVYEDMLASANAYGRGLKRANFFVLKYNTVPSILIEVGYMSSPVEAEKLKTEEYQNKLAIGIFKGISRYISEYNRTEGFTK
ncbi:MAG: N-acetylmuramoyl-L-alanine amidase family protein [Brevinema sp.]